MPTLQKTKNRQFLALGYGVNAYFNILIQFIGLFFILTLINCAIIYVYASFDGMKSLSGASLTAITSIGNLGQSSTECSTVNYGVHHNIITCPYGSIKQIYSFGVHPKESQQQQAQIQDDESDFGKSRNKGVPCVNHAGDTCNQFLDLQKMNDTITNECLGKEYCSLSNFKQYFNPQSSNPNDPDYKKCTDDKAILYVQVFCMQDDALLSKKAGIGYGLSTAVVIQATIFILAI